MSSRETEEYLCVLGLEPNSSEEDIQRAFRHLALQYHPDRTQPYEDNSRFEQICEAFSSLNHDSVYGDDGRDIFFNFFKHVLLSKHEDIDSICQFFSSQLGSKSNADDMYIDDDEGDDCSHSYEKDLEAFLEIVRNCQAKGQFIPDEFTSEMLEEIAKVDIAKKQSTRSSKVQNSQVPLAKQKPKSKKQKAAEQRRREKEMVEIADQIAEKNKAESERAEKKKQAEVEKQKRLEEERLKQAAEEKRRREREEKERILREKQEREEREAQQRAEEEKKRKEKDKEEKRKASEEKKKKQLADQKAKEEKERKEKEAKKQQAQTNKLVDQTKQYPPREVPPRFAQKQAKVQQTSPVSGTPQLPSPTAVTATTQPSLPSPAPSQPSTPQQSPRMPSAVGNNQPLVAVAPKKDASETDNLGIGTWLNPGAQPSTGVAWDTPPNVIIVDSKDKEAWPSIGDQSVEALDAGDDNASIQSGSVISSSSNPGQLVQELGQGLSAISQVGQSASSATDWATNAIDSSSSSPWGSGSLGPNANTNSSGWSAGPTPGGSAPQWGEPTQASGNSNYSGQMGGNPESQSPDMSQWGNTQQQVARSSQWATASQGNSNQWGSVPNTPQWGEPSQGPQQELVEKMAGSTSSEWGSMPVSHNNTQISGTAGWGAATVKQKTSSWSEPDNNGPNNRAMHAPAMHTPAGWNDSSSKYPPQSDNLQSQWGYESQVAPPSGNGGQWGPSQQTPAQQHQQPPPNTSSNAPSGWGANQQIEPMPNNPQPAPNQSQQAPGSWAQAAGKGLNLNTPKTEKEKKQEQLQLQVMNNEGWGAMSIRQDQSWDVQISPEAKRKKEQEAKEESNMWNKPDTQGIAVWEKKAKTGPAGGPGSAWNSSNKPSSTGSTPSWGDDEPDENTWTGPPKDNVWTGPPREYNSPTPNNGPSQWGGHPGGQQPSQRQGPSWNNAPAQSQSNQWNASNGPSNTSNQWSGNGGNGGNINQYPPGGSQSRTTSQSSGGGWVDPVDELKSSRERGWDPKDNSWNGNPGNGRNNSSNSWNSSTPPTPNTPFTPGNTPFSSGVNGNGPPQFPTSQGKPDESSISLWNKTPVQPSKPTAGGWGDGPSQDSYGARMWASQQPQQQTRPTSWGDQTGNPMEWQRQQKSASTSGWESDSNNMQWSSSSRKMSVPWDEDPQVNRPDQWQNTDDVGNWNGSDAQSWNKGGNGMQRNSLTNNTFGASNMKQTAFPNPSSHPPQMRSKLLQTLVDMGFKREDAQNALISNNMNFESAIRDLVTSAQMDKNKSSSDLENIRTREIQQRFLRQQMQDGPSNTDTYNQLVPPNLQNTPNFVNAQSMPTSMPQAILPRVGGATSVKSASPRDPPANSIMMNLMQQQKLSQTQAVRGQVPQSAPANQQQMQQQIAQQLQLAVQAGLINPKLLNQQLSPQVLNMLQQLLQLQNRLQRFLNLQQVLQQNKTGISNMNLRQQIDQEAGMIPTIKSKMIQLQQEIAKAQHTLPKDPVPSLQSHLAELSVASKQQDIIQPSQQTSRLSQWKLPSPSKDDVVKSTMSKAPGSKLLHMSHSTPDLQSGNKFDSLVTTLPSITGDVTWANSTSNVTPTFSATNLADWPASSAISTPSLSSPGTPSSNSTATSESQSSATANAGGEMNMTDFSIPEFIPGKPWQGFQTKNVEDDPHITPGSMQSSSISVNTIKDDVLSTLTALSKSSPSPSSDTSTSTWSALQNQRSLNPPSKWAPGIASNPSPNDMWSNTKSGHARPPPGLTNQKAPPSASTWTSQGQGQGQFNRSISWAGTGQSAFTSVGNSSWDQGSTNSAWLVLRNLTPQIDGSTLRTLCQQHGPLQMFLVKNGQAIVKYHSIQEAAKAQKSLNTCVLGNTTILAEFASEEEIGHILSGGGGQPVNNTKTGSMWNSQTPKPRTLSYNDSGPQWSSMGGLGAGLSGMWSTGGSNSTWAPSLDDPRGMNSYMQGDLLGSSDAM